jgi:hypothetical protein
LQHEPRLQAEAFCAEGSANEPAITAEVMNFNMILVPSIRSGFRA